MNRFPYCVFYVFDADGAVVLGCLHARRNPTAWRRPQAPNKQMQLTSHRVLRRAW